MNEKKEQGIWLEVQSIRLTNENLSVQVRADKNERAPHWWPVSENLAACVDERKNLYRDFVDGLDKKRLVLVKMACPDHEVAGNATRLPIQEANEAHCLVVVDYRIQFSDSSMR